MSIKNTTPDEIAKILTSKEFSMCGSKGVSIDLVSTCFSDKVPSNKVSALTDYANDLVASFGQAPTIAKQAAKHAAFGLFAGAGLNALGADGAGAIMALGTGLGAMSGVFASATNGSLPNLKGKSGQTLA